MHFADSDILQNKQAGFLAIQTTDTKDSSPARFLLPRVHRGDKVTFSHRRRYAETEVIRISSCPQSAVLILFLPRLFRPRASYTELNSPDKAYPMLRVAVSINRDHKSHLHHDRPVGFGRCPRRGWGCAQHPLTQYASRCSPFLSAQREAVSGEGWGSLCCPGSTGMHINHSVWRVAQTHCPFILSLCRPFPSVQEVGLFTI